MIYTIDQLKALTLEQYDQCRSRALERVGKRIGEKPERRQFQRELGRLWTVLDIIALVVFIPSLVVSSIHIIGHMGGLAGETFKDSTASAGTLITKDLYVAAHQWMFIPLAEGSMILFLVMFGMSQGWRRWVAFSLALLSAVFVLVANVQSGLTWMEALLAPAFTIGIGLKLEYLIVESLRRRDEVNTHYLEAMAVYEAASADATLHPDYQPLLRQEIWQKLVSLKANQVFADAPTGFKHLAVKRELAREQWAYQEGAEAVKEFTSEEDKPKVDTPFGNTAPALGRGDLDSTKMTEHVNGRGGEKTLASPH